MKQLITIREHARLTTAEVTPSLDEVTVPASVFDWLCELNANFTSSGAALLHLKGHNSLKWDNYVGVLESPCGTRLEILPKHFERGDCVYKSRALLKKLIQKALSLKPRQVPVAGLELFDAPLSEWVMSQFLTELDQLVKRGMRFDYQRIEEEQRFLHGQLNVIAQMRQPLGRQHWFQIRHDVFLPNRAENRLLKLALEQVSKATEDVNNLRLANELRVWLQDIPASTHVAQDFCNWSNDRLMAHYHAVKPWCSLILNQKMPLAVSGEWQGVSLLFPMEKLFERYVASWLREKLSPDADLKAPARSEYLCKHNDGYIFRLEPDLLIRLGPISWVLDTKWKRIATANVDKNYQLDEADFYQMLAYAKGYMKEGGRMALIYPKWLGFIAPLEPFEFDSQLKLWVIPFDLDDDVLIGANSLGLPLNEPPLCP